ncbi:MAG: flavin reductase family protein [Actinomycetota bacterium]
MGHRPGGVVLNVFELRTCLGCFGTGVTVVTVQGPSEPRGLTVNAFTSVSLDPPLILVSINKGAKSHDLLTDHAFAVNVLASDQEELALNFAGKHDPQLEIPWREGKLAPYLGGTVAHFQCEPHSAHDGGDHTLLLGRIVHFRYNDGDALGYFRSKFTRLVEPVVVASPGTLDPFELPYDAYE